MSNDLEYKKLKEFFFNIINNKQNNLEGCYVSYNTPDIHFKNINGINFIGDLIVFKDKIISPIDTKFQYVLDSLKPYLINNNYNNVSHMGITDKDFIVENNKIYFDDNLICEVYEEYIIHYKFKEIISLSSDKIKDLINGKEIIFRGFNLNEYCRFSLF